METIISKAQMREKFLAECTPGYYNNEGQPMAERARLAAGYPSGPVAFFKYIDNWRTAGDFKGLNFTS